jgi:hypothetical protein
MTVQDLIDKLNKIEDKTTRIVVKGYEAGYDDIDLELLNNPFLIELNVHKEWYYGSHDRTSKDNPKAIKAFLIN